MVLSRLAKIMFADSVVFTVRVRPAPAVPTPAGAPEVAVGAPVSGVPGAVMPAVTERSAGPIFAATIVVLPSVVTLR